jgi:hypothetical protein
VTDLISETTVVLLVLLILVGAALVYLIIVLSKMVVPKEDYEETVRPLVGVVMPNEKKKGRK